MNPPPFSYSRRFPDERQQYRRWIDPRYRSLRLVDVVAYLESRGWKQVPADRPNFLVFQEPAQPANGEDPLYQFVPDSEHWGDYRQRMFELLTGIAEVEDRQAAEVIDDILYLAQHGGKNGIASQSAPAETSR